VTVPDIKQFKLPDVGEGLVDAEIVSWKVKPGDTIKVNDIIVEIETAKSLVELPSPYAGRVADLLVPEGQTVDVGTPIIAVDTDPSGTAGPSTAQTRAPQSAGTGAEDLVPEIGTAGDEPVEPGIAGGPAPGARTPTLVGYGPRETGTKRRARPGAAAPAGDTAAAAQEAVQATVTTEPDLPSLATVESAVPSLEAAPATTPTVGGSPNGRSGPVLAKPPVRKLAKDLGIDLSSIAASGPGGIVTRADVEAAASGAAAGLSAVGASTPSYQPGEREVRTPIKGVRKMTAQAMVSSAFTAPHVTEFLTVDATRTMKLVERLKSHRDFRDARLSPMLILARAMIIAIRRTPEVNSTWDEARQEIVQKSYVNLGIAAATPRGLVVPNIKDADRLTLRELADAVAGLVSVAREGKTQPADMAGGTITITNVGVFGVDSGTPIINPGESAIMAFGAIKPQPWVVNGAVKPRLVTTLSLSFDHRVVDGEQGSKFLADVGAILEDPGLALALG
jgi:pyruvate dehydrogenase E2 component (dihydrolipoamide acetyltransferase)